MLKQAQVTELSQLQDEQVLEEAAKRLQKQYENDHGSEFRFGSFRFIFHDGRFQGIEEWPRNKRYISPKRTAGNE